eukprot:105240-Heterocapsa_arctica.AAC.1
MKAEEKRSTAEAALSMRVDNLQKCYTDLVHKQQIRRHEIDATNERSKKEARAAIREIIHKGYRSLDLQEEAYAQQEDTEGAHVDNKAKLLDLQEE